MFTLDNKLQVLLVNDLNQEASDKGDPIAYCSLAVQAGVFNDPPHRNGLAHFLEHMIFMGSEEYPKQDDYNGFLSENGGYANAFTQFENTNYQFEIPYPYLEESLNRMAANFAHPLLLKETISREVHSIESEF